MSQNIKFIDDYSTDITKTVKTLESTSDEIEEVNRPEKRNRSTRNRSTNKFVSTKNKGQQITQTMKENNYITDKLSLITRTTDLPPTNLEEQKFSGRSRLFIGNIPSDVTEEDIISLFKKYGEVQEVYINPSKTFAFVKLDYYINALRAKTELFGYSLKGRNLVIRFTHLSALHVKNLSPNVTNELLQLAFSIFGEIDHCFVIVDEKGKSKGEGIVEFAKKSSATTALKKCSESCFILTSSLRPVIAEKFEPWYDINGFPEILAKKNENYYRERDRIPHFAEPGTFEYDYAKRWKDLHEKFKIKINSLKNELLFEEQKLEADMIAAQYDHETERLKKMLQMREMDRERIKQEWELRQRQLEERRLRERQSYCNSNTISQEETNLFIQANQLTTLLDHEEHLQEQWQTNRYSDSSPYERRSEYLKREATDSERWVNLGENYNRGHKRLRL